MGALKGVVFAALIMLPGCVSVTVTKDMVERDPVDCADPAGLSMPETISAKPVASHVIADAPGKTLTSALLTVPPGATSKPHTHADVAYGYVIEGAVYSQIIGDAGIRACHADESFFEPPESQHLAFTIPGLIEAMVLVTQVADTGAQPAVPLQ